MNGPRLVISAGDPLEAMYVQESARLRFSVRRAAQDPTLLIDSHRLALQWVTPDRNANSAPPSEHAGSGIKFWGEGQRFKVRL